MLRYLLTNIDRNYLINHENSILKERLNIYYGSGWVIWKWGKVIQLIRPNPFALCIEAIPAREHSLKRKEVFWQRRVLIGVI